VTDLSPGEDGVAGGVVNLFTVTGKADPADPPGYRARMARFGPTIGAEQLGGSVYELDPGESVCPYHYEHPEEEWLLVLEGEPTLRDPDGEHELSAGDLVCFLEGPEGAHKITNRSAAPVRILMLSTKATTAVAVYPDGGKVGVWPLGKYFRLEDAVGYYEGEV
jgi:uncharacterized cupin superfamily protein